MHFSKISTALIALAVSVPEVIAMPTPNLDVRQVPKAATVTSATAAVRLANAAPVVAGTEAKNTGKQVQTSQNTATKTSATSATRQWQG
ncbi:hypothetical protein FLAG1_05747 [Fusarium langsethiae]|uniref:Uncharacterized protein n=1 Tax=Fusarium langsethiae TaxID=179993 RepID=A0A0M9EX95_FUSLA|nr:hypothetical protein FLAG1_05747 [Fusarium langsethiae]GKU03338.1 unnamed protein product [Fusarium langsethiae]GKU20498.1 unnamed protein product [Fusarium langsethiae]